jgi:thymidylate synthase (FAD)
MAIPEGAVPILDKGFIRLVDFMGGDLAAVQAARVSYASESKGADADKKLINYLLKHDHMTPFEQTVFKFHVSCPIFVMRQWIRHRMASYNEISGRYTEVKEEFYIPETWRSQDTKNKQGSASGHDLDHVELTRIFDEQVQACYGTYQKLLEMGVAREMARMILPLNGYTQFYWAVNARSLMNFMALRADVHAQWEIQKYAEAVAGIFEEKMPWTFAAFLGGVWRGANPILDARKRELCPGISEERRESVKT